MSLGNTVSDQMVMGLQLLNAKRLDMFSPGDESQEMTQLWPDMEERSVSWDDVA